MRAYGKNVVARPAQAPKETAGGLVLPPSVGSEYKCRGIIIDVGNVENIDVGDEIIFTKGSSFEVDSKRYIVVSEDDILIVL